MAEESLITDEARAMIGKENEPITSYAIPEHEMLQYSYAIDDLNPLYVDKKEAEKGPYGSIIAPPLFYSIPFGYLVPLSKLREDGLPPEQPGEPTLPLKVTRLMAAGVEVEFGKPVKPGDVLTWKSKIADIYERTSKSGTKMVFVIRESIFTNQKGEMVAIEYYTFIIR